jgi:hypothetical protein
VTGQCKNLIILRAGDRSLHWQWLKGTRERNFDLHISYFGNRADPYPEHAGLATISFDKGSKYLGLKACIENNREQFERYDRICLPDDDLSASGDQWTRFFEIAEQTDAWIAQPALDPRSFYSHQLLVARTGLQHREVTFVEVMMPTFTRAALAECLPLFTETASSHGLDVIWSHRAVEAGRKLVVVDCAPVLHTRRVGGGVQMASGQYASGTPSTEDDRLGAMQRFGIATLERKTRLGVTLDGQTIMRGSKLNRGVMAAGFYKRLKNIMRLDQIN